MTPFVRFFVSWGGDNVGNYPQMTKPVPPKLQALMKRLYWPKRPHYEPRVFLRDGVPTFHPRDVNWAREMGFQPDAVWSRLL